MDQTASALLTAPPERVFAAVADLAGYPSWLTVVLSASPAEGHRDDPGPAWVVELGARLGPVGPVKRVRMVRVEHRAPTLVRFERLEHDGSAHAPWVLGAEVDGQDSGTLLTMRLHYGGRRLPPLVDLLLGEELKRAGGRLQDHLGA